MTHEHIPDEELQGKEIEDPELLWVSGFYDGPTSGMIRVDGEMLWATMITECFDSSCGFYRRYKVMRLSPETMSAELQRNEDFCTYVAMGKEDGWSFPHTYRPQIGWERFYLKYRDYEEPTGEVVGWFQR